MLNSAGIFSSNRVALSIDQKQLGKKKVTIVIPIIEVGKLIPSGSEVTFPASQSWHQSQLDLLSHSLML